MTAEKTQAAAGRFLLVPVLLIIAGFLGNYCNIPLFFGADFLFGSVFVLLVLYFFGLGWGMAAAVIVHSYTYFLWGHPYGFISFTAETFFVGFFLRKGPHRSLIALDWLYWVFLGMPLAWFFHGVVMHMGTMTVLFIMLKQAINSIFNALLASLAISYLPLNRFFRRPGTVKHISLQESLFNFLIMMLLFPALLLTMLQARQEKASLEAGIMTELQTLSANVQLHLRSWHQLQLQVVEMLASLADKSSLIPSEDLQYKTEVLRRSFTDFVAMHIEDASGRTIAFDPKINEKGESTIGADFSDRSWFQDIRSEKKPVVSAVITGRAARYFPIITISVPLNGEGQWLGCATGTLDLKRVQHILQLYQSNTLTASLTLTDPQNRIIASTIPDLKPMQSWKWKESGVLQDIGNTMFLWRPADKRLPSMTRWNESDYVQEISIGPELPWSLIIAAPVAPLQQILYTFYVKNLTIVASLMTLGLILSHILSHGLSRSLIQLAKVTADIPEKLSLSQEIDWPSSTAEEFDMLIGNFKTTAKALDANFREIRVQSDGLKQTNAHLQQEIEERQQAQKDLQRSVSLLNATLESTADGILVVDLAGFIVSFNKKFSTIWGIPDGILRSGQDDLSLGFVLPQLKDPDGFVSRVRALYEQPEVESFDTIEFLDGRVFERYSKPQYLGGEIAGRVWSFRDVTVRRRVELEKKSLQMQLIQAQKMEAIGTLAGGIAHDFNNTLGSILGYAEMAREASPGDSVVVRYLDNVLKASERAATLVKQILAFSRQTVIERVPLNPADTVREALKFIRSSLPSTVTIQQQIESAVRTILADSTQVHQILMNLCTNACHAMEMAGGTLGITLGNCELARDDLQQYPGVTPGRFVVLTVSDTGTGIAPEIQERIFDPYFTTKEVGKGTGMGLSIVHGIVTGYGGFITCEQNTGKGTVFSVYFPAIDQETVRSDQSVEVRPAAHERILLVDDEEMLAELGKTMLEYLGYEVTMRTSSLEALSVFESQPDMFDAVVTDQTIPGMTGMELARRILQIRPEIPIILCTGYSTLISEEQAKVIGIRAVAMKPLSMTDLGALLGKALAP